MMMLMLLLWILIIDYGFEYSDEDTEEENVTSRTSITTPRSLWRAGNMKTHWKVSQRWWTCKRKNKSGDSRP